MTSLLIGSLITGNVTCAAYPLDYFDTINTKTGDSDTKSALNLISFGVSFIFIVIPVTYFLSLSFFIIVSMSFLKFSMTGFVIFLL